jgi:hypothetical protein
MKKVKCLDCEDFYDLVSQGNFRYVHEIEREVDFKLNGQCITLHFH